MKKKKKYTIMPTNVRNDAASESAKISCAFARYLLLAGFLPCLLFNLEDENGMVSEISVDFQRTTRRYIPEDETLHVFI
jgi:hypothetical protein